MPSSRPPAAVRNRRCLAPDSAHNVRRLHHRNRRFRRERGCAMRAVCPFQTACPPDCGNGRCKQTRPHRPKPPPASLSGCNNTDTPALRLSDGLMPPHRFHTACFGMPPRRPIRSRTPPACAGYVLRHPPFRAEGPNPPCAPATFRRGCAHRRRKRPRSATNRCAASPSDWGRNVLYTLFEPSLKFPARTAVRPFQTASP